MQEPYLFINLADMMLGPVLDRHDSGICGFTIDKGVLSEVG